MHVLKWSKFKEQISNIDIIFLTNALRIVPCLLSVFFFKIYCTPPFFVVESLGSFPLYSIYPHNSLLLIHAFENVLFSKWWSISIRTWRSPDMPQRQLAGQSAFTFQDNLIYLLCYFFHDPDAYRIISQVFHIYENLDNSTQ